MEGAQVVKRLEPLTHNDALKRFFYTQGFVPIMLKTQSTYLNYLKSILPLIVETSIQPDEVTRLQNDIEHRLLNVARKCWLFAQDNFSGTYLAICADKAAKK